MNICAYFFFFFNDTATTEIYTLSLHDALPISPGDRGSSRTVPVRRTLVSCVSDSKAAQVEAGTSFLERTPCTIREASGTTTNAILPLERVVTTQPRTATVSPTCARSPLISTAAM